MVAMKSRRKKKGRRKKRNTVDEVKNLPVNRNARKQLLALEREESRKRRR